MGPADSRQAAARFFLVLSLVCGGLVLVRQVSRSSGKEWWGVALKSDAEKCAPPPLTAALIGKYGSLPWKEELLVCDGVGATRTSAQTELFQQGMLLLYGFNYDEARRNFQAALAINATTCAFCRFGLLYSFGPNLNRNMEVADIKRANTVLEERSVADDCPLERELLLAQQLLFDPRSWNATGEASSRNAYVRRLANLVDSSDAHSPAHPLLRTFLAEAILNTQPWKYYSGSHGNKSMDREVRSAFHTLQSLVGPEAFHHPLALHLYIHMTEQSDTPGSGTAAADALAAVMRRSGTGHLVHMPGHTYMRTGHYDQCIAEGLAAIEVDRLYRANCVEPYAAAHNVALVVVAALAAGRLQLALEHAPTVMQMPDDLAVYLTALWPTPRELVLSRFGRWRDIIDVQASEDKARGPLGGDERELATEAERPALIQAMRLYARSLALIHSHSPSPSTSLRRIVLDMSAAAARIPRDNLTASHVFYPNHREIGLLMNATVHAAAATKQGHYPSALAALRAGMAVQDGMSYMEPENFYLPLRQCLAAVLLVAADAASSGRAKSCRAEAGPLLREAVAVLERDLDEHPATLWARRGLLMATQRLHECSGPGAPSAQEVHALRLALEASPFARDVPGPCCEISHC